MTEPSKANTSPLRVLQFTDTHLHKDPAARLLGVDTARSFMEVYELSRVTYGVPDVYLFTGDLSQDETEESYRRLAEIVGDAGAPCYFLPGNHDRRAQLFAGLLSGPADFRADRRIVVGSWQILLLDTLVESQVGGLLAPAELEFLEDELAKGSGLNTLVCLHHHPVPVGTTWMDHIGLSNADEFLRIIDRHKNVRSVLWGHIHQEFELLRKDVLFLATPSTCVQFKPRTETFSVDAKPPGFRWLELYADGSLKTAVCRTAHVASGVELSSAGY